MAATFLHFVQACALALLGLAASGGTSHANPSTEIGDILAGIIHYTRWPHPQPSVRVCLNAQDPDAALIADYFERSYRALPPVVVRQYRLSVESLTDILDCQVVYFGRTSPVDANPLLIQLAKFPILTIGHSEVVN